MKPASTGPDLRRLVPILLIIFTNILGAGAILPILPLYAEGQFGGSVFQVTLLATSFFGAQFIGAPILGRFSDQYGRRPILILSQIGTVVAFILFIFAGPLGQAINGLGLNLPISGGMFMLYFARILDGLTGGNITTAQAYVSDITADEDRAQGLGMLQGAFGVGFIFGPAFGGLLGNFGPLVPFIGAAIITTGTLLLTTFTLKESLPPEERTDRSSADQRGLPLHLLLQEKSLTTILAIAFFATLAFAAFPAVFSLYADKVLLTNVPPNRVQISIGLMLTYHGLVMVVTQFALLRPLVKRFGERRLILMGDIALAASMFVVAPITDPILATALFTPLAFGQGITLPSLQALMTRFGNRQMGGRLLGLYQSARSLALIFGPVWAGYVFQQIRPQMVFVVGSVLCVIAALLALLLLRMDLPITRVQPQSASQQAATD